MVVSKSAVANFLAREEVRDLRRWKRERRLLWIRDRLKRWRAQWVTKPFQHQEVCLAAGLVHPALLFFLGMGAGKTKLSFDLIQSRRAAGQVERALVLVPAVTNIYEWIDQAAVHAPKLAVVGLTGAGREARQRELFSDAAVVVATYQGLVAFASTTGVVPGKRDEKRWTPDRGVIREITRAFQMLVLDESTTVKNAQSLYFRVCRALSKEMPYRYALTGTPVGKSPIDLWAQFFLIDRGEALGPTLGLFRDAFFSSKPRYWGGVDYTFKKRMMDRLNDFVAHSAISYTEDECQDLPAFRGGLDAPTGPMVRSVPFPSETLAYYQRLRQQLREQQKQRGTMAQGLKNTYVQMRMLSAGFLGVKVEDKERVEIVFKENPKLEALVALLREIPEDEKVVVACVFHKSGDLIAERLKKERISCARLYSKTRDKRSALASFKDPAGARVLLGSETIAFGLNLQGASRYMVFYDSPDSVIRRKQMERRIRRTGAARTCYYYDLQVRESLDGQILEGLRQGKNFLDLLLRGKRGL